MGAVTSPATGAPATPTVQPAAANIQPRAGGSFDDTYNFVGKVLIGGGVNASNPASVAVDDTIYVADSWSGSVFAVAPGKISGSADASVNVTAGMSSNQNQGLFGIAVDRTDDTVYVVNRDYDPKTLWAIDGKTMTVTDSVQLNCSGTGHNYYTYRSIAVNSQDDTVYIPCTSGNAGRLVAVNGRNLDDSFLITQPAAHYFSGIAVDETTDRVYAAMWDDSVGTVQVRNGATLALESTIPAVSRPSEVSISDDTLYVASSNSTSLLARDLIANSSTLMTVATSNANAVERVASSNLVFVGGNGSAFLRALDAADGTNRFYSNVGISAIEIAASGIVYTGSNGWAGYGGLMIYAKVPNPPAAPTANAGNGQAVVSWVAPASMTPITDYRVTASPGGASCTVLALTCTISGLTNGTAYTFKVQAENAAGWGSPSAASAPVTPLAPPPPTPVANMQLTMSSSPARFEKAGDVLTITATVFNSGTDTLNAVQVRQGSIPLTCTPATPLATLPPGESIVCRGTHTVTEADSDAGVVRDRVTASATAGLTGAPLSATAVLDVQGPPPPERLQLRVVMASSPPAFTRKGEKLSFTALVTNTGNVPVRDVVITGSPIDLVCTPSSPVRSLAVKATMRCGGTYVVTKADMSAGAIRGLTRATGSSASGARIASTGAVEVSRTSPEQPSLKVTMTSSPDSFRRAGQVLTFSAVVTNNGDVVLTNVTVTGTPVKLACVPSSPISALEIEAKVTCTGTHTVTQADVRAGVIRSTVRASGTSARGNATSDDASIRVRLVTSSRWVPLA